MTHSIPLRAFFLCLPVLALASACDDEASDLGLDAAAPDAGANPSGPDAAADVALAPGQKDPNTSPRVLIDRFSAAAGNLMVRTASTCKQTPRLPSMCSSRPAPPVRCRVS